MWERNSLHGGRKPSTLLWDEMSSHNKLAARAAKVAWARTQHSELGVPDYLVPAARTGGR